MLKTKGPHFPNKMKDYLSRIKVPINNENIIELYKFDSRLRRGLYKYIDHFEKQLKALIYDIDWKNKNYKISLSDFYTFDYMIDELKFTEEKARKEIRKIEKFYAKKIDGKFTNNSKSFTSFVLDMSTSTVIDFIKYLNTENKSSIRQGEGQLVIGPNSSNQEHWMTLLDLRNNVSHFRFLLDKKYRFIKNGDNISISFWEAIKIILINFDERTLSKFISEMETNVNKVESNELKNFLLEKINDLNIINFVNNWKSNI